MTPGDRPPDAISGTWPIELAPSEVRKVRMHTCCLDAGRACPRPSDRFQLAEVATKPAVEAALRWWTDHPRASQGFVNQAIWSNDLSLLEQPYESSGADGTPQPIGPKGRRIRLHGGFAYLLNDGVLTSVDPEGVHRFHGTQIYDVHPRADALYGLGRAAAGYDVWKFAATGEPPWGRVFPVADPSQLDDLIPVRGGAFLTRTGDDRLLWRASREAEPRDLLVATKSIRFSIGPADVEKGRFVAVVHQRGTPRPGPESVGSGALSATSAKFAVFDVDARAGTVETRKIFWNASDMVAGPGGVFALSPVGSPERLDGEKLRRLPGTEDYASILLVGTAHLVLMTKGGGLVSYDVKTGRTSALPGDVHRVTLVIDPVNDDLAWVGDDGFRRWRFGAAGAERIP